jgi:hypothetical protein
MGANREERSTWVGGPRPKEKFRKQRTCWKQIAELEDNDTLRKRLAKVKQRPHAVISAYLTNGG